MFWTFLTGSPESCLSLHYAARYGKKAGVIEALLEAGADAKAKHLHGDTPWDLAQDNDKLKDTKGYWALNDAQYK